MKKLYAHSPNSQGRWHGLEEHLKEVAGLAKGFADKFGAGELAYWVGLWHDAGKAHPAFQEYLKKCAAEAGKRHRGPDHKGAGSLLAQRELNPLAFVVAGHHGGLKNLADLKVWLAEKAAVPETQDALSIATNEGIKLSPPSALLPLSFMKDNLDAEFFIRMLFSTLVDADFLDTESHFNHENTSKRGAFPSLIGLWRHFEEDQNRFKDKAVNELNRIRNDVYQNCIEAAALESGFFRLTVPTGGGKTRSSMAFALNHAIKCGMDRVIVAIPYTSIIEQTADVYRVIFGNNAVLEHHSAITPSDNEDEVDDGASWARLAAENWDAPIVVTTTVQLFESLFSSKTSRCRKLHNIANSIIILDEVQTLPTKLLTSILDALRQLVTHYRVSVVFCTATQPALDNSPYLKGIEGVREIVPKPGNLFSALKRVKYEWGSKKEKWDWGRVAEKMRKSPQSMTIVNTKKDAISLLDALEDQTAIHLSTLLCGAHRRDVLKQVRQLLNEEKPCRLVSTQVVEAGVDLDFPLVLRAIGPLDRIVQAAGRCNREGRLRIGRMVVFNPAEGKVPPGDYRTGTDTALSLLETEGFDFHNPAVYETYFSRLYQALNTDAENIQELRKAFNYQDVNNKFRMIEDLSIPVVVRYQGHDGKNQEVDNILSSIKYMPPHTAIRRLQPYVVNIHRHFMREYERDGLMQELMPGLWEWLGSYDNVRGLVVAGINPESLVVGP